MASVPNMNVFPTVPKGAAPAVVEGEGGDVFASLLAIPVPGAILTGPPTPQVGEIPLPEIRAAIPEGETDGAADGEAGAEDPLATLIAQTQFVPVVQPQPGVAPATVTTTLPAEAQAENAPIPAAATIPAQTPPTTLAPVPAALVGQQEGAPAPAAQTPAPTAKTPEPGQTVSSDAPGEAKVATKAAPTPPTGLPVQAPGLDALIATIASTKVTSKAAKGSPAIVEAPAPPAQIAVPSAAPAPTLVTPIIASTEMLGQVQSAPSGQVAAQAPQPAEQAIERELDLAHEGEWLDRLARDIARAGSSDGPMRFKLHPQTLGHMRVELTQGDHGTSIRLTVETEAARTILADAQPRLLAEARAQGVRIAQTDIDLAGSGHQAADDPRRQDDARQTVLIRTPRGSGSEAAVAVEPGRTRSDRYA